MEIICANYRSGEFYSFKKNNSQVPKLKSNPVTIKKRDIKPTNIFLDGKNNIKIGDFGLAIQSRKQLWKHDEANDQAGTPMYSSPEQISGSFPLSGKADVYPIGIILVEICYKFGTEMERNIELCKIRKNACLDVLCFLFKSN